MRRIHALHRLDVDAEIVGVDHAETTDHVVVTGMFLTSPCRFAVQALAAREGLGVLVGNEAVGSPRGKCHHPRLTAVAAGIVGQARRRVAQHLGATAERAESPGLDPNDAAVQRSGRLEMLEIEDGHRAFELTDLQTFRSPPARIVRSARHRRSRVRLRIRVRRRRRAPTTDSSSHRDACHEPPLGHPLPLYENALPIASR
jgi:hypothetical protein